LTLSTLSQHTQMSDMCRSCAQSCSANSAT